MWCVAFVTLVTLVAAVVNGYDDEDGAISDDTLRTVYNVLLQDSWYWTAESVKSVADQQVFIDGQLRAFIDVVGMPPRVDRTNVQNVTSAMYVALSCKCGETIADALAELDEWLRIDPDATAGPLLAQANAVVLKTASVLFHLADVAPNAWSHEPGMLYVSLSLNMHLNHLMMVVDRAAKAKTDRIRRVVFQMINLIERFTIPNCSSSTSRPVPEDYSSRLGRSPARTHKNMALHLLEYLHHVLDNSGLSTVNCHRYNVGNYHKAFNIVSHVMRHFRSAFNNRLNFAWKTADVQSVFHYQRSAFEFVLFVAHKSTLTYLEEFKENRSKGDECFLSESNIKRNGLVRRYEQLLVQFVVRNFPPEFADHVRLMLRIFNDVSSFKNIRDLNFLIRKEKNDILVLTRGNTMQKNKYFRHLCRKRSSFKLHAFLQKIATISYVKYYNDIFKSLQNYFKEPNEKVKEDLDKIDYTAKIEEDSVICESFVSVYAYCFDIQSSINDDTTNPKNLKLQFFNVLNYLKALLKREEQYGGQTINYILINANQYLSYNLTKYPTDGDVREKLNRILYTVTNFVDKYQARYCNSLVFRDRTYNIFRNYPEQLKPLLNLKSNFVGKMKFMYDDTIVETVLCNRVLFNQFVTDFGGVQQEVKMFWKGELKTINEISTYLSKNLFDYSSIPRYINVVVEWIAAVFSYSLLDVIYFILNNTEKRYYYAETDVYNKVVINTKWPAIHHSAAQKPIIEETRTLFWNENRPFQIIGILTALGNNLKEYDEVFQRQTEYQNFSSLDTKKLIKMMENLKQMSKSTTKSKSSESINQPLQYKLSDYFLLDNNDIW